MWRFNGRCAISYKSFFFSLLYFFFCPLCFLFFFELRILMIRSVSSNFSLNTLHFLKQHNILYSNALIFLKGLPSIQVPHENYTVNYGESITLECTVVSNPEHTSMKWTKLINGNYISIHIFRRKIWRFNSRYGISNNL